MPMLRDGVSIGTTRILVLMLKNNCWDRRLQGSLAKRAEKLQLLGTWQALSLATVPVLPLGAT